MNHSSIRQISKYFAIISALSATSPAFAIFNAEVSAGKRSGTFKPEGSSSKTLESTSIQLAAHLDPIPLVPVSFGVRFVSDSYDAKVADHGVKEMSSTAIVPEITAWLPVGDLRPFARVGYTAVSAYKGKAEAVVEGATLTGDVVYKSAGPRIAAGVEWKVLPFISVMGAYEYSSETISITSGKVGSFDLTVGAKDTTYSSGAILAGVKAGL